MHCTCLQTSCNILRQAGLPCLCAASLMILSGSMRAAPCSPSLAPPITPGSPWHVGSNTIVSTRQCLVPGSSRKTRLRTPHVQRHKMDQAPLPHQGALPPPGASRVPTATRTLAPHAWAFAGSSLIDPSRYATAFRRPPELLQQSLLGRMRKGVVRLQPNCLIRARHRLPVSSERLQRYSFGHVRKGVVRAQICCPVKARQRLLVSPKLL